ncbi:hypothetical protein ACJX0J_037129, partial [Zea mays]
MQIAEKYGKVAVNIVGVVICNKHMLYALAEDLLVINFGQPIIFCCEDYKFLVLNEWAPVSGKCCAQEHTRWDETSKIGMREKRDTSKDITINETVEVASMMPEHMEGYDVRKWQPLDNCEEAYSMPFRFL